ncbi:hypothetical protein [Paraliomyxa miuraensis]|uniref:hypothetical protein n=1 Tax=Paraliomyxa miuraensis TaxID=376150 RepID=UPI00225540AF|nr:hypothetical protein [Paraliomyxa miuraensis]MCX4243480.1 hypothetical protein [Paraliomyxa miuraensis]
MQEAGATATPVDAVRAAWWRVVLTAAVLAAVWWPARPGGTDGFPLSTYPMFGYARAPTSVVETALGVDAAGRKHTLRPVVIVGTSHPKLALATVKRAVAQRRTEGLCREIAARAAALPEEERPVAIEVATETWDTLAAFAPGAEPQRRKVHARCEVSRGG